MLLRFFLVSNTSEGTRRATNGRVVLPNTRHRFVERCVPFVRHAEIFHEWVGLPVARHQCVERCVLFVHDGTTKKTIPVIVDKLPHRDKFHYGLKLFFLKKSRIKLRILRFKISREQKICICNHLLGNGTVEGLPHLHGEACCAGSWFELSCGPPQWCSL